MAESRFIRFCIKGLEKSFIPSEQLFATRRLTDRQMVHSRDCNHEYLFTMLALLGLHQAKIKGSEIFLDTEAVFQKMVLKIDEQADQVPCIAATAWVARSMGATMPKRANTLFLDLLKRTRQVNIGPKAFGYLMAACLAGGGEYLDEAHVLAKLAFEKYINQKTFLVNQLSGGFQKNWSFIGSHTYMAYIFLLLSRKTGDNWARDVGLRIARRLVMLQGRNGEWAWMYHTPTGKAADYYPTYSIHQYAYAPFFLIEAIDLGYDEFRLPLLKGFRWILGQNDLGKSMVEPEHSVIWRRMLRKGIHNSAAMKVFRGYAALLCLIKPSPAPAEALEIDYQCHGFEMGLPLYIFSGRTDFNEILDDPCFDL